MTTVVRTNAVSTYVNQVYPSKAHGTNPVSLALRNFTSKNCYGYIHFSSPVPKTVKVQVSTLKFRTYGIWAVDTTVNVYENSTSWSSSTVTWNTRPSVYTPFTSVVVPAGTPSGTLISVDVTNIVKRSQTATAWRGFRINISSPSADTVRRIYGSGTLAPQLEVTYLENVDTATQLTPGVEAGNVATYVARPQPDLSALFDPNVAGVGISAVKVQMTTTETSGAPVWSGGGFWDSGWVPTTDPFLRISDIVGAPSPANGSYAWWRIAYQADNGAETNAFSVPVKYYYGIHGVLSITGPSATSYTSTPVVNWTFTGSGRVQQFYQILVTDPNTGDVTPLWDSGRRQSSVTTSLKIPENVVTELGKTYKIVMRVWDTLIRQAANDKDGYIPTYAEDTQTFVYALNPAVTAATALTSVQLEPLPVHKLTWTSATAPDAFEISRNGQVIATDLDPLDLLVSGTTYSYTDISVPPLGEFEWEVRRIVGDSTSANNPTVSASSYNSLAWLSNFIDDIHIAIAGESPAEVNLAEQGTTYEPVNSGVPVHITQSLGGYRGKVSGVLCGECLGDGTTSEELQERLLDFREAPGAVYYFYLANIAVPVVIYNVTTYPLYGSRFGHSYGVEFDWHEVRI